MSSSDDEKKPEDDWTPMNVGGLDRFEDISTKKPIEADFNALFFG